MKNYFATLNLPESLSLETEAVDLAWRSATLEAHPDAADAEAGTEHSADLNLARASLSDPVQRLEHWLDLRTSEASSDRSIQPELMDLFTEIHSKLEAADSVISRLQQSSTALAKALLTKEAIAAQLGVQNMMRQIQLLKGQITDQFPEYEIQGDLDDFVEAYRNLGQLKFLKKWEQQCQTRLLSLLEC
tara:strand:+ start:648 stop:1214 length:567 start_codon:yes stop_codon:yes gene_type:complete